MTTELDWCAPESCSLPPADQQGLVSQWRNLLDTAVKEVARSADGVRLVLDRGPGRAAQVADLADRESRCCPFLAFDLEVSETALVLTVRADAAHTDVAEAFAARASRGR